MAGAIVKKSERSLSELLNIFRAPFSEDHSWAVCYQCAKKLQKLRDEFSVADMPTLSLTTVYITSTGSVEMKETKRLHVTSSEASKSAYQSVNEVVSDLGMLVYDLLDYGLDDNEERALPQKFEHLIDCMTSDDDTSCSTSDIGSDCDSDSDQILGIIRSSSKSISLQEIIQVCESQVSSSVSTGTHYQLMCKRLFEEAGELVGLTVEENDEAQDKINHRTKWSDVLKDVETGITLKKVSSTITDSISSPILSAHEIVQLSVKSFSRENLKPVLVNNNKGTGRITDPYILLMQEIRAIKPNLRPVSERAKGHCMARALTPMEILMEEIRTPPILRRVHNTMSDTEVVNNKKKLLPSPDLVADLSDEAVETHLSCPVPAVNVVDTSVGDLRYGSCTELRDTSTVWGKPRSNSSPSSPRFSSSQRCISPLCSTQSNMTNQSSISVKAAEVKGVSLEFKSISFSAVNGAEDCVFHRRQLYHSWQSEDALSGSRPVDESDSEGESVSHDARSLQSDDEFPSSTKELIQIRHILSKADLVNLQLFDNKTYREITRGKLCCACKRRRFSLMCRPHNCIVCQKLVCGKCVSKITLSPDDLPSDHPVKLVGGRKNSSDACIPCRDFLTSGGATSSHQQVTASDTSHSSSDQ